MYSLHMHEYFIKCLTNTHNLSKLLKFDLLYIFIFMINILICNKSCFQERSSSITNFVCPSVRPSVRVSLPVRGFLHISYITRLGEFLEVARQNMMSVWSYDMVWGEANSWKQPLPPPPPVTQRGGDHILGIS